MTSIPGIPLPQPFFCKVFFLGNNLMCQIGTTVVRCICETCFQSLSLRHGKSIQLVLSNENAQIFLCREISQGIISFSNLVKLSSIVAVDKPPFLLSCSFQSFCNAVDESFHDAISSGKSTFSKQVYDSMVNNMESITSEKQRVSVEFIVLHRNLSSFILSFAEMEGSNRFYVLNQKYDAESCGEQISVCRCEIHNSPVIMHYPSILQDENKLLPGATYRVENALKEGHEFVIDSRSTIIYLYAPVIPPKITCFSVSGALRLMENKPIWMIGKLIDYSFVGNKEKCLVLIQDGWTKEVIEFWSAEYIQRFSIGQILVFADINVKNKISVYTNNSFVFCSHSCPMNRYERFCPLPLSCDYYSWQVIDVVAVSSIEVQLVCPYCQRLYFNSCSCNPERLNCKQLCLIHFVCVLDRRVYKGVLRGDAGFRWLNFSEEIRNEILDHIHLQSMWNSDVSTVFDYSYTRKLLGRVKMLTRKLISSDYLFSIDIEPVDLQVLLENTLSRLCARLKDVETMMQN